MIKWNIENAIKYAKKKDWITEAQSGQLRIGTEGFDIAREYLKKRPSGGTPGQKPEMHKGKRHYSKRGELPKYVVEGLVLIQRNPNISDAEVAREVKKHPSTLSHNEVWRERSAGLRRDLLGREPQGGRKDNAKARIARERKRQETNSDDE